MKKFNLDNEIEELKEKMKANVLDHLDCYKEDLQRLENINALLKNDLVIEICRDMRLV